MSSRPYLPVPLASSGPLPTPPDSPRGRRRQLRDSGDTEGDMSIESYLYRCDPYRSTTVSEPFPFPVVYHPVPTDLVNAVVAHRTALRSILLKHGLPSEFELTVVRVSKPGYPNGHNQQQMVRIGFRGAIIQSFGEAKDDISNFLNLANNFNIHIELLHIDNCFRPSLFPINPRDPSVQPFKRIYPRLVEIVNQRLMSKWRMLSMFLMGRNAGKTTPTIVVMVQPRTKHRWSDLVSVIRNLVRVNTPASMKIDVEFIPGDIFTTVEPDDRIIQGVDQKDNIQADGSLGLGASITVQGEQGGGSLGGFVTLSQDGNTRNCALTNYHVVRPARNSNQAVQHEANRLGSVPWKHDLTRTEIIYFSPKDVSATKASLDHATAVEKESLKYNQQQIERQHMKGREPSHTLVETIKLRETSKADHATKRAIVDSMPLRLGRVYCSSGQAVWDGKVQDWGLVQIDGQASHVCQTNKMPFVASKDSPTAYGCGALEAHEGKVLEEFGELKEGEWYVRVGRTSTKHGVCNGLKVCCNWDGVDMNRYDSNGSLIRMANGLTEEFLILNRSADGGQATQKEFGLPGDSGSFLVDRFGQVCGLYYGNATSWVGPNGDDILHGNAGLAMAMPDIISGIKYKTKRRNSSGNPFGNGAILGLPK